MAKKDKCFICKFEDKGICRKNPPKVLSSGETRWPDIQPEEWCGEFAERIE